MEEVKSPTYATGVGLVLAGFRALDDRDNQYAEYEKPQAGNKVVRVDAGRESFKNMLQKVKGLLLDEDLEGNDDY